MHKEPVSRELFDDVMVPNYAPGSIIPVRGEGSRIWDQDGREFIDLQGGIAVNCLGHSHPGLVGALQDQAKKIWHLSNVMTNEPALRLAKTLCDLTLLKGCFLPTLAVRPTKRLSSSRAVTAGSMSGRKSTRLFPLKTHFTAAPC